MRVIKLGRPCILVFFMGFRVWGWRVWALSTGPLRAGVSRRALKEPFEGVDFTMTALPVALFCPILHLLCRAPNGQLVKYVQFLNGLKNRHMA
jgi:hypothetical protein